MAHALSRRESKQQDFVISVKTGDICGEGTNNKFKLAFINEHGEISKDIKLNAWWERCFRTGELDNFEIKGFPFLGSIESIEILRIKGFLDDRWFVEVVKVKNRKTGIENVFPVNRWVPTNNPLRIKEFDASLPQFVKYVENREEEIQGKKNEYVPVVKIPNWLPQLEEMPDNEKFSFDYLFDLDKLSTKAAIDSKFESILSTFQVIDHNSILHLYDQVFEMPKSVSFWKDDAAFGRQRLNHVNCTQIRICERIPNKFAVKKKKLKPELLEGLTLKKALRAKRLYYIDYGLLEGIKCMPGRQICAPFALFFVTSQGELKPVAIQLFQEPSETNPVFHPTDDFITWQLAKMWFNNADASFHQSCTHLGFTHLLMEAACVAVHRSLSPSHPIYRLLAPHFLYLFAINNLALTTLVNEGGYVDKAMSIGREGMFEIMSRQLPNWRLDVQGSLPEDLKNRGVDDVDALPNYFYRDDALKIYNAIREYIKDVLSGFYEPDPVPGGDETDGPIQRIHDDFELQEFARCLSASVDDNGVGIPGVHGGGKFRNQAEVIDVCTSFIFIASAGHAAANFGQYDDYRYPPCYPAMLTGTPVSDKRQRYDSDISAVMPPKDVIFDTLKITKVLSTPATKQLGNFEVQYLFDPNSVQAANKFRRKLQKIESEIRERNKTLAFPYIYLLPGNIPNAISI